MEKDVGDSSYVGKDSPRSLYTESSFGRLENCDPLYFGRNKGKDRGGARGWGVA